MDMTHTGSTGTGAAQGTIGLPVRATIVVALVALWLLHVTLATTAVVAGLTMVVDGASNVVGPSAREGGDASGAADRGSEGRPSPDGGARRDSSTAPSRIDDDVWRLDGFADFSDSRMRVAGGPGGDWTESRLSGRTVWIDDRCRVTAEVVDIGAALGRGAVRDGYTDAEVSEELARSIGAAAFGGAETRSDPHPATTRLPLARGRSAVELATVALVPAEQSTAGASFVVVSARTSVEHGRAVVFALACIDTPASQADALARDLLGRFRLEIPR